MTWGGEGGPQSERGLDEPFLNLDVIGNDGQFTPRSNFVERNLLAVEADRAPVEGDSTLDEFDPQFPQVAPVEVSHLACERPEDGFEFIRVGVGSWHGALPV
jgi:hypothetical protein